MNRYLLFISLFLILNTLNGQGIKDPYGAIVRSDTTRKTIYLCFTGHDFYEGFDHVLEVLKKENIKGSFFLTGNFVRNHSKLIKEMAESGHYLGGHSDRHLLYVDWEKRDSLLISPVDIRKDILDNVRELEELGIFPKVFMPPYEWYNEKVVEIAKEIGQATVNFSSGTRSNADYTTPEMNNYVSSQYILTSIYEYESREGLNGFHLLIHPGTDPIRKDKLYFHLEGLINELRRRGYGFERF